MCNIPGFLEVKALNFLIQFIYSMIKGQGAIKKVDGTLYQDELLSALHKLPNNRDYEFLIVDKEKNRTLPASTYLFSVVLPQISEQLPDHPPKEALYRYFEDIFAPLYSVTINGEEYEYSDLKREKIMIINEVCEKIVDYAEKKWGIKVMSLDDLRDSKNSQLYSVAYKQNDVSWAKFLSHQKSNS